MKRELTLSETTFERMKNLNSIKLYGNQIKLEGNCFKHLTHLKELNLSRTILDSENNNEIDIMSSLTNLEEFWFHGIESCASFQLYRVSELVNLKELSLAIEEHDIDQFREMLRRKRRAVEEVRL